MIYLLVGFLLSFSSFSMEKFDLIFSTPTVQQGGMIDAKMLADGSSVQSFDFQKLKGQSYGKTLYFYSVSPFMKKDGESKYESDVKVIFTNVPQSNSIKDSLQGKEFELSWNKITVQGTQTEKGFKFLDFEVPSPTQVMIWVLSLFAFLGLGYMGFILYKRQRERLKIRDLKIYLKTNIYSAKDYSSIVEVWKNRKLYVETFPHIIDAFKEFEKVLFKHQFKPFQSEIEKTEVVSAYEIFLNKVQGGFHGI